MRAFRRSQIRVSNVRTLKVNGLTYEVLGTLGGSHSQAYLCKDDFGRKVVVKQNRDQDFLDLVHYEVAATGFYRESGVFVPGIYDHEVRRDVSYVVKEYREGITLRELELHSPLSNADTKRLLKEADREMQRLYDLHEGFADWLDRNHINLERHAIPEIESLIEDGDIREDNMLYDIKLGRWILFDP